ncbi:MAG TPA: hypothetical protein VNH18_24065 [Bryobacteraceae bacterium]|nr:hypothetical protein [Bryobacteraceae bacterium]
MQLSFPEAWYDLNLFSPIFQEADKFISGAPQYDDMTVLICRV